MIEKDYSDIEYLPECIVCNKKNCDKDGQVIECAHLYYVGCNETPDEPWFDRDNIVKKVNIDETSDFDYLTENLNDNYYCINLLSPSPGALHIYFIYKT